VGKITAAAVTAIAAAATAAGKALWDMANQTAEYGDEIEKNSQKVGLSFESYQKWDYAMKICGTEMSSCTTGLKTLTNTFDDAVNGSSSATEMFNRLGLSIPELQEKITAVKSWLYTEPDRYHELRDTYDTDCFRKAVLNNALDIEDELNKIGVFTVSFSCLPFKYLDGGQTAVSYSNGGGSTLVNPTFFDSKPLIRVNGNGSGTLKIINRTITTLEIEDIDSFLYIDSEQMNCYKGAASMNDKVTSESFPVLCPGQNVFVFSGGITSIAVTPRWVTL
ncbi:MAG: hypothetical protein IJR83_04630, partial [Clostridia bacterium]|nr:hypothetical protein [Clostridia bacterium]